VGTHRASAAVLKSLVQVKIVRRPLHTKFTRPPKNVGIFLAKLVLSSTCVDVYMAKLNASVQTLTIGGFRAAVTDITRRCTNQLDGYVHLPAGPVSATWNFMGVHSAGDSRFNLDMSKPEHQVLRKHPSRPAMRA